MNPGDGSPAAPDFDDRIAQLEREFARLGKELVELRALASASRAEPEQLATITDEAPSYPPTVRYDLVPDALALPLAGVIAAIATVIALRWSSQIVAAIGLLGAALAPALQALDTKMEWTSTAFAVIVLAAAAAVSVPRAWN